MATERYRQTNPDGTVTIWYDDGTQAKYGNPVDPIANARQSGQAAAAQTQAIYGDPWYQSNVLDPMNRSAEQQAKERASALQMQAKQLELQGRVAEANILNQQAQIELRKWELQANANAQLAAMRGPGNAAQFIDLARRQSSMGVQSGALAQMAAGNMPTGAFVPGGSGQPQSLQDRMSGMMSASQSQIDQRDANDQGLANQIASRATQMKRGSFESLSPYERDYLGSYVDKGGNDWGSVQDAYKRAGIMQGRGY